VLFRSLQLTKNVQSLFSLDKSNGVERIDKHGFGASADFGVGVGTLGSISYSITATNSTWIVDSSGVGVSFYISDEDGYSLYYSGGLCGGVSDALGQCSFSDPGSGLYIWRVSGAGQSSVSWSFCGATGDESTELIFSYIKDVCTPVVVRTVQSICALKSNQQGNTAETLRTAVDLRGIVHLHGIDETGLTEEDVDVVRRALTDEFADASHGFSTVLDEIQLVSEHAGTDGDGSKSRKLSISGKRVVLSFKVKMTTNTVKSNLNVNFVSDVRAYVQRSMESGLFLARIKTALVSSYGASLLDYVSVAVLQDLFIEHEKRLHRSISSLSGAVVVIGTLCGVVCSILLVLYVLRVLKQKITTGGKTCLHNNSDLIKRLEVRMIHDQSYTAVSGLADAELTEL